MFPQTNPGKNREREDEKVQVWYGFDEIMNGSNSVLHNTKSVYCSCIDANGPIAIMETPVRDAHFDLKRRGIKARFITEITKENLDYCKEMMKCGELRHLDGIKGNFAIADAKEYGCIPDDVLPPKEFIYSNMKTFVQQQQFFFETLWKKAIPSKLKIREIEEGIEPEVIETIHDPKEMMELYENLASSAKTEILAIFSNNKRFSSSWTDLCIIITKGSKLAEGCSS